MTNVISHNFRIGTRTAPCLASPEGLFAYLRVQCDEAVKAGTLVATLMIRLGRADRLRAHLSDPRSERLMDQIVASIGSLLRPIDRFAVVSHEEIWIVLPDLAHVEIVGVAANRILALLETRFAAPGRARQIQAIIGAGVFPRHAPTVERLLEVTEQAAHSSKIAGNPYFLFEGSPTDDVRNKELENELRDAILGNNIEVHYQPQIDITTGKCVAAEALLRLKHADGTPISPSELVGIAERTDIIHSLSHLILATALRHVRDFERSGWQGGISVNLSARLLNNEDLPEEVAQLLEIWRVNPTRLTLEITETSFVSDIKRSIELLGRLRKTGVRLAMDDFGTGYSSLAQFRQLPLNEVKIDQIFVQNMQVSVADRQIVQTMIDLARNFGMQTVAEGVGDQATLDCLREMRCDLAQGFLFSQALPCGKFIAWTREWERAAREPSDLIV